MGSSHMVGAKRQLRRGKEVGGSDDLLSCEHPSSLSGAKLACLMQTVGGRACLAELPLPQMDFAVINW